MTVLVSSWKVSKINITAAIRDVADVVVGPAVMLALSAAVGDGRIKKGDLVLLEAMGGGFTWGAVLLRW